MIDLLIIGAGASGLFAAAHGACNGLKVTVIEHTDKIGKKILSTGNGKCNMTNLDMSTDKYYCSNLGFMDEVLGKFDENKLLREFESMGLMTRQRNGYVYPYSEQASTVRELLVDACMENGVTFVVGCNVNEVVKDDYFTVKTDDGIFNARNILLATGGMAFSKSGSDGSGYEIARRFGHKVHKAVPALTPLTCREKYFKKISGVRAKGRVELFVNDNMQAFDEGEIQFADYGVSGIPVFNISRVANKAIRRGQNVYVCIDLMPDKTKEQIFNYINENARLNPERRLIRQITYCINGKLAVLVMDLNKLDKDTILKHVTKRQICDIVSTIKCLKTEVTGNRGFDFAQVTAGGVSTSEIRAESMESKIVDNLYFAGEIIDVDGICGGYNLHFAWASAFIAVESVLKKQAIGKEVYEKI